MEYWGNEIIPFFHHSDSLVNNKSAHWVQFKATFLEGGYLLNRSK